MRALTIGGKLFSGFYQNMREAEFFKVFRVRIQKQVSETRKNQKHCYTSTYFVAFPVG